MCAQLVVEEPQRGRPGVKRLSSTFSTQEEALESAKALVESGLLELWQRGMSAQTLLKQWSALGEEVYVLPDNGEPCFSSSDYAKYYAGRITTSGLI